MGQDIKTMARISFFTLLALLPTTHRKRSSKYLSELLLLIVCAHPVAHASSIDLTRFHVERLNCP